MTASWNGTAITGPVFIYQDEIIRDDRPDVLATPMNGTVICRSQKKPTAGWYYASGIQVSTASTTPLLKMIRKHNAVPSVARLTTNSPDEANTHSRANGLWRCRATTDRTQIIPVGIYARGEGKHRTPIGRKNH